VQPSIARWCCFSTKPILWRVLSVLISLLHQLRDGYTARPKPFPQSVALVGLKDVRDYRVQTGVDTDTLGTASPFNIKVQSLSIGYFTQAETAALLQQHQDATGQAFTDEAIREIFHQTQGQPWLVNALAGQLTTDFDALIKDRNIAVTRAHILTEREILIERRDTHLDSLVRCLQETRIKRVIEPIMIGEIVEDATYKKTKGSILILFFRVQIAMLINTLCLGNNRVTTLPRFRLRSTLALQRLVGQAMPR